MASASETTSRTRIAGVVMKAGTDYVTLENYSVGNEAVDNDCGRHIFGSG